MARTSRKTKTATVPVADQTETSSAPANVEAAAMQASGTEVFIPLSKLKKSPRNARKTPHSEASIEQKAASIAAKGMIHNLVVEPELDAAGQPTGCYFVTIGEGRRLAQLLRAKRKEIKKTEPIRCVIDTANDPFEISLDENFNHESMHPADLFEAYWTLHVERGWGPEEIAARGGGTPQFVRRLFRLAHVSPRLIQLYRDGGLNMEHLQAFAITDDHARQEQVYELLSYNRDPSIIRRELTQGHVPATERRAIFVGAEAYAEAGGSIIRDLFTEDRGGFFEDPALLDRLAAEKLERIAAEVQEAEGWKWVEAHINSPDAYDMRRVYPHPVELSEEDEAAYAAARDEQDRLTAEWDGADVEDLPPEVAERFAELEAEVAGIDAKRRGYDPDEIARGGVFVVLSHDGTPRIERGFIRPEDEAPEPEEAEDGETIIDGVRVNGDGEVIDGDEDDVSALDAEDEEGEEDGKPLSDALIRDLTAHRTMALRAALGEQPDIALIAVTHALAAQTFYRGVEAHCLEIRPNSPPLARHADGIGATVAAKTLADRHDAWASDMPRNVADLWGFIAGLDRTSVMALLAHCVSQTVNAVMLPWEHRPRAQQTAEKLATMLALDMTAYWTPTVRTYFGRVTKAHIIEAVREAVGDEAVKQIAGKKKQEMAEAAERDLAATGWLPAILRTSEPTWLTEPQEYDAAEPDAALEGDASDPLPDPDDGEAEPEPVEAAAEEREAFPHAAE